MPIILKMNHIQLLRSIDGHAMMNEDAHLIYLDQWKSGKEVKLLFFLIWACQDKWSQCIVITSHSQTHLSRKEETIFAKSANAFFSCDKVVCGDMVWLHRIPGNDIA